MLWTRPTILDEDVQALLDKQRGIEYNQTEADGKDVVAGADFEEGSNGALYEVQRLACIHASPPAGCRVGLTHQSFDLLFIDGCEGLGSS